jgi:hypothetical protein
MRGANIVMPNLTPPEYRVKYEIYPNKACINKTAEMCRGCLQGRAEAIERVIRSGPGGRAALNGPTRPPICSSARQPNLISSIGNSYFADPRERNDG